jgi:hypothetical protein
MKNYFLSQYTATLTDKDERSVAWKLDRHGLVAQKGRNQPTLQDREFPPPRACQRHSGKPTVALRVKLHAPEVEYFLTGAHLRWISFNLAMGSVQLSRRQPSSLLFVAALDHVSNVIQCRSVLWAPPWPPPS